MLKYRLSLFLFTFLIIQSSAQLRDRISLSGEWQFFKGDTAGMHKTGQRQIIIEAKEPIDIISICLKTRKKNVYSSDSKRSAKKRMYS